LRFLLWPNVPDQLPGRLQRLHVSESKNAGPVNLIGLFGAARFGSISSQTVIDYSLSR